MSLTLCAVIYSSYISCVHKMIKVSYFPMSYFIMIIFQTVGG